VNLLGGCHHARHEHCASVVTARQDKIIACGGAVGMISWITPQPNCLKMKVTPFPGFTPSLTRLVTRSCIGSQGYSHSPLFKIRDTRQTFRPFPCEPFVTLPYSRLPSPPRRSMSSSSGTTFYDLKAELPNGQTYDFEQLKGKVVLIVNVASKWYVCNYCRCLRTFIHIPSAALPHNIKVISMVICR
jgi:hypothetical protein